MLVETYSVDFMTQFENYPNASFLHTLMLVSDHLMQSPHPVHGSSPYPWLLPLPSNSVSTQTPHRHHIPISSSLTDHWFVPGLPPIHQVQIWFHTLFCKSCSFSPMLILLVNSIHPFTLWRNLEDILSAFPSFPSASYQYLRDSISLCLTYSIDSVPLVPSNSAESTRSSSDDRNFFICSVQYGSH